MFDQIFQEAQQKFKQDMNKFKFVGVKSDFLKGVQKNLGLSDEEFADYARCYNG